MELFSKISIIGVVQSFFHSLLILLGSVSLLVLVFSGFELEHSARMVWRGAETFIELPVAERDGMSRAIWLRMGLLVVLGMLIDWFRVLRKKKKGGQSGN